MEGRRGMTIMAEVSLLTMALLAIVAWPRSL
jgi:hypothetical protein